MLLTKPVGAKVLTDRTGARFPVIREFGYDSLLNSVPFYMADKQNDLNAYDVRGRHMIFTTESRKECAQVIDAFKNGSAAKYQIKRIVK